MTLSSLFRARRPAAVLLVLMATSLARAQEPEASEEEPAPPSPAAAAADLMRLGGDGDAVPSLAAASIVEESKGVYRAEGYVDLRKGELRLQADWALYDRGASWVEAGGAVVLQQGEGSLSASRLELDLETGAGTLWDVTGYQPPFYIFRAERMERIDAEHYRVFKAEFTTCTQPTPYWSFAFSHGRIHLEHYAHLRNVRLKTSGAPIFYSPYVVWPIKQERASGFLLPTMGSSDSRGTVLGTAFYWAVSRSMDATFFYDYYSLAGDGLGLEYRLKPSERGNVHLTAYELTEDTDADGSERYRVSMQAEQSFARGWKLISRFNRVSDGDYYNDFEREFDLSVNDDELSFLDLSRSWSYYTLALRTERREQFFSGSAPLVQQRLPEVELRARSQKLGKSPLYLSFDTSANALERRETDLDARYERLDAGATLSASLTPTPWLDLTPSLTLRETVYTQTADPNQDDGVSDDSLDRSFVRFQFEVLGPKLFRVFEPEEGSDGSRFKNTWEPRLSYDYVPEEKDAAKVILFDEIDRIPAEANQITASLTNRFFRRRRVPRAPGAADDAPPEYESSREIASVEVRQSYCFVNDSTCDRPGGNDDQGPITLLGRYNPTRALSADLQVDYDVEFDEPRSISLSGSASSRRYGQARLSYFLNRGVEEGAMDSGNLRVGGGSYLLGKRLKFNLDFTYDLGADNLQSQRYIVGYDTQCCGFQAEYLERDFGGLVEPAREFRFSVTLSGVGTLFDLNSRIN